MTKRIVMFVVLAAMTSLGGAANASFFEWNNPSGGDFSDGNNWVGGVTPSTIDWVEFRLSSSYVVTFSADVEVNYSAVAAGDVTFDLGGHTYTSGSFAAESITPTDPEVFFTIQNGLVSSLFGGGVFSPAGTVTTLRVTGSDAQLQQGPLADGWRVTAVADGHSVFVVDNGAFASLRNLDVGAWYEGTNGGEVVVQHGGTLQVLGLADIGSKAPGRLLVEGASASPALFTSEWSRLGIEPGALGTAEVRGDGATWNNQGELIVGDGGQGALFVGEGGQLQVGALLDVGRWGTGTLLVQDGGQADSQWGRIGVGPDSVGEAQIGGDGSRWINQSELIVGDQGHGTLRVLEGGQVDSQWGRIGLISGAVGEAEIRGDGSSWINQGELIVGHHGHGALHVLDGGSVQSHGGNIGFQPDSVGYLLVSGADSTLSSTSAIHADYQVGFHGHATLEISDGGSFSVENGNIFVGRGRGAVADATVTGSGSSWTGNWELTIAAGEGPVEYAPAQATVSVLDGAELHVGGRLDVGQLGTGTLLVQGGGQAASQWSRIGVETGSVGEAQIGGEGSSWINQGELIVGDSGQGTLHVHEGGQLQVGEGLDVGRLGTGALHVLEGGRLDARSLNAGLEPGSLGTLLVSGSESTVHVQNGLMVAASGTASLTVADGANISVDVTNSNGHPMPIYIGIADGGFGEAFVAGVGSQVSGAGFLQIGGIYHSQTDGFGRMTISDGGLVDIHGWSVVGQNGGTGEVIVRDPGSSWLMASWLDLGFAGTGSLSIENGGTVATPTGVYMGYSSSGSAQATVSGAGSLLSGRSLVVSWGSPDFAGDGLATLTVDSGGLATAEQYLGIGSLGTVDVSNDGRVNVGLGELLDPGVVRIGPGGELHGNGTIVGDLWVDGGHVSPGFSPGTLTIDGDAAFEFGSMLSMEIAGLLPGSQYDHLMVTGDLLFAGTLQLRFIDGFRPDPGDSFELFSFGGMFDNSDSSIDWHDVPAGFAYSTFVEDGSFGVLITAVPEPSTWALMAIGTVAIGLSAYRRQHRLARSRSSNSPSSRQRSC